MRAKVVIAEDRADAGKRPRSRDVDSVQARVRVRAAKERRVQKTRKPDVVDESPLPAQQRPILDALDAATQKRGRTQSGLPIGRCGVAQGGAC
jgi:hypothetical protein